MHRSDEQRTTPFGESSSPPSAFTIVGHAEQISLLSRVLKRDTPAAAATPPAPDAAAAAAAAIRSGRETIAGAFESSWPSSGGGLGGSWGTPPTSAEELGEAAAARRRRTASATSAKTVLSRLTLWKEQGLTPKDVRTGKVGFCF